MRWLFLTIILTALLLAYVFYRLADTYPAIIDAYQKNGRTGVFTGFITLGSFLLALKSTMLQRLKEGFDSKEYKRIYEYHIANGGTGEYYESLKNISLALATCVPMALVSSAIQMTLGFSSHPVAFAVCAAIPTVTLLLVLFMWHQITKAHGYWLDKIEDDKQAELLKQHKP